MYICGYVSAHTHVYIHKTVILPPPLQVVDETDRLLRQSYQDWLPKVLHAVEGGGGGGARWHTDDPSSLLTGQIRTIRRL